MSRLDLEQVTAAAYDARSRHIPNIVAAVVVEVGEQLADLAETYSGGVITPAEIREATTITEPIIVGDLQRPIREHDHLGERDHHG